MWNKTKKTRIYFTTDIHGSERCFIKFINAGKFYGVDILILGGDITGKIIVPIVRQPDGSYSARFMGADHHMTNESEIQALEKQIRFTGYYPYRTNPDEVRDLESEDERNRVFRQVMCDSVARWLEIAEERLKGTGIRCFMTPGNDDLLELDAVLEQSDYVENPDGKCVWLDDEHEMISTGWSNPTPWNSPRECSEEELAARIEAMMAQVSQPENLVMNLHCPPYDCGLDVAPELTHDLRMKTRAGNTLMQSVGSMAVRQTIEKHQPLVCLHGHIHESRGVARIKRTACVNPGSEYTDGVLKGALVTLKGSSVRVQLVSG